MSAAGRTGASDPWSRRRTIDPRTASAIERANTLTGPHLAGLPDGSFFVSDPSRRTVIYVAPTGQPYGQLTAPDALVNPTGVAATLRDGLVYVAVVDSARCNAGLWRVRPVR